MKNLKNFDYITLLTNHIRLNMEQLFNLFIQKNLKVKVDFTNLLDFLINDFSIKERFNLKFNNILILIFTKFCNNFLD